jgi:hypothetical protein
MSGVTAAALARASTCNSPPSLARSRFTRIEEYRPTILIDEFDAAANGNKEMAESLRGQLNSSFNRSGAHVLKSVPLPGGGWEVRKFSTWAPTCLAGIGRVPDTVADRSVVIRRLRHDQPKVPKELNDRAQDAWEPLFAIADIAGADWPKRARSAAMALASVDEAEAVEGDFKLMLLSDIRDIFVSEFPKGLQDHDDKYGPRLATKRLLDELHRLEERSWSAWGKARKPMSDVTLAGMLRGYGIRSGSVRLEKGSTPKGYYLRSFQEAFARYLSPISPYPPSLVRHAATTSRKPEGNPSNSADCVSVATQHFSEDENDEYDGVSADPDPDRDIVWPGISERS